MTNGQVVGATGEDAFVPEWDIADRMRKALRHSGISVQEMAEYLGVSRNTAGTWINGRIVPSKQTMRLWALRTGVPFSWLQTGELPVPPDGEKESPLTDSNRRPSLYKDIVTDIAPGGAPLGRLLELPVRQLSPVAAPAATGDAGAA